jgi:hypothetical protein
MYPQALSAGCRRASLLRWSPPSSAHGGPLTGALCTRCGLCCDGTLFADVELSSRAEPTQLEGPGLEIESDVEAPLLVQPCAALRGRRCSIYAHRPGCCRTFECKLLQDLQRQIDARCRPASRSPVPPFTPWRLAWAHSEATWSSPRLTHAIPGPRVSAQGRQPL